ENYALDQLHELTTQYIQSRLSDPALTQALELLERYVEFYRARDNADLLPGLAEQKSRFDGKYSAKQLAMVQRYYEELGGLKREYFSEQEREVFFADEEQYTHYMLSRMEITHVPRSPQEKQVLLD